MSAAAPWSVKGIDPKAREIAKDLARRSGMTLGEWLNGMIMDGDDDDDVTPLPRRPHVNDIFERRGRSRRLDDAYAGNADETLQRVAASIEAIAERLEAAERRSTVAIQGVDQAVSGLVRRLDGQDKQGAAYGRRIDDIAEELREGHRRLRRFEQETGPQTSEAFGKVETSLGALAGRLYDIEERQRTGVNELRQRMDAVEKAAGPGVGADLLAQVGARLDGAQARTTEALRRLEQSFAGLDQRLRHAESRVEPEGAREAARFEKLAETLSRQVETNRVEMMRRLDTAQAENRIERVERAVLAIGDQVKASEQRSAQAVEAMGREVLRIAQNLNGRVEKIEATGAERLTALGRELSQKVEQDMGRYAQAVDQRLIRSDDRHALALEKLGGEITRISDQLADRIAQSERRSQQALDDIGRRLADSADRMEQRHDRASGELAERMRLSEERTARLLAEARDSMEQRQTARREEPAPLPAPEPSPAADLAQPDWRAAAFPDAAFDVVDDWSAGSGADPFPTMGAAAAPTPSAFAPSTFASAAEAAPPPVAVSPVAVPAEAPFGGRIVAPAEPATGLAAPNLAGHGGFGGADVRDALEATAPPAFDGGDVGGGVDDYAAETEFVDPRAMRVAASGRAASTRSTIDAARAAMEAAEAPARSGFGLKRGGKSKLQERLDKQTARQGSTVRKALLASVTATAVVGAAYGYDRLTDGNLLPLPGLGGEPVTTDAAPIAALALDDGPAPVDAVPVDMNPAEAPALYENAVAGLEAGDPEALDAVTRAAGLGHAPAQLHLARLYQSGGAGVPADATESRLWARRAAEGGDALGMHAYAMYLFEGVGGPRNRPEALDWLKRAAGKGLIDSQYNVARIYERGDEGIAANAAEALKWYLIAARGGDAPAQAGVTRVEARATAAERRAAQVQAGAFQADSRG